MSERQETRLASTAGAGNPFSVLRQLTSELDRVFDAPFTFRWPVLRTGFTATQEWAPKVDVFEKDHRLITRIDLPGLAKEDVLVEAIEGYLVISGERKREKEEKKDNVYHTEREYGRFYRAVPLPEGVKVEDVKATFGDGVLEVIVPLPIHAEAKPKRIEIEGPATAVKPAA